MIITTNHRSEIISVIKDFVDVQGFFTIWQRDAEGEITFQTTGTLESVDEAGNLVFSLAEHLFLACRGDYVFFAADKGKLLYKSLELDIRKNKLYCELPDEIKYLERRKYQRKKIRKNDIKEIEISCSLKEAFEDELEEDGKKIIVSRLIDYSAGGACFMVSSETIVKMNLQAKIELKCLSQNLELNSGIAVIVNARELKMMTLSMGKMYAVGVMFI